MQKKKKLKPGFQIFFSINSSKNNFLSLRVWQKKTFNFLPEAVIKGDLSSNQNKTDFNLFFNVAFDKGRLKSFVLWFLQTYGQKKTIELLEKFKEVGFGYATKAGISLGIDDLKIPPQKQNLIKVADKQTNQSRIQCEMGEITGVEKLQRFVNTWHETSETLKKEVVRYFEATDTLNPVYMMAFSGARGNLSQVRQLVGMRGLMADPQGQIIDFPIRSNFREGLTLTEYIISTYGARKGIVDTALRTANAGYLTRRLVDVAQHVIVAEFDCKTNRGIVLFEMKEGNKTIYSLQNRLIGRVLAKDFFFKQQKMASRNEEISADLASSLAKISQKILVRSPLTCQTKNFVCQLCYGWSLSSNHLVSIGEAVGIIAAQSIGEPGTQLTMRTFHTGGVFSGGVSDQIIAQQDGIVEYIAPIAGTCVRTLEGELVFLTKSTGSLIFKPFRKSFKQTKKNGNITSDISVAQIFQIPVSTLLFIKNGQKVIKKQTIAQFTSLSTQKKQKSNAEQTIYSQYEGEIDCYWIDLFDKQNKLEDLNLETFRNKGFIWILSGKIYQSPIESYLFANKCDFIDKNSILNQIDWATPDSCFLKPYLHKNFIRPTLTLNSNISQKQNTSNFFLSKKQKQLSSKSLKLFSVNYKNKILTDFSMKKLSTSNNKQLNSTYKEKNLYSLFSKKKNMTKKFDSKQFLSREKIFLSWQINKNCKPLHYFVKNKKMKKFTPTNIIQQSVDKKINFYEQIFDYPLQRFTNKLLLKLKNKAENLNFVFRKFKLKKNNKRKNKQKTIQKIKSYYKRWVFLQFGRIFAFKKTIQNQFWAFLSVSKSNNLSDTLILTKKMLKQSYASKKFNVSNLVLNNQNKQIKSIKNQSKQNKFTLKKIIFKFLTFENSYKKDLLNFVLNWSEFSTSVQQNYRRTFDKINSKNLKKVNKLNSLILKKKVLSLKLQNIDFKNSSYNFCVNVDQKASIRTQKLNDQMCTFDQLNSFSDSQQKKDSQTLNTYHWSPNSRFFLQWLPKEFRTIHNGIFIFSDLLLPTKNFIHQKAKNKSLTIEKTTLLNPYHINFFSRVLNFRKNRTKPCNSFWFKQLPQLKSNLFFTSQLSNSKFKLQVIELKNIFLSNRRTKENHYQQKNEFLKIQHFYNKTNQFLNCKNMKKNFQLLPLLFLSSIRLNYLKHLENFCLKKQKQKTFSRSFAKFDSFYNIDSNLTLKTLNKLFIQKIVLLKPKTVVKNKNQIISFILKKMNYQNDLNSLLKCASFKVFLMNFSIDVKPKTQALIYNFKSYLHQKTKNKNYWITDFNQLHNFKVFPTLYSKLAKRKEKKQQNLLFTFGSYLKTYLFHTSIYFFKLNFSKKSNQFILLNQSSRIYRNRMLTLDVNGASYDKKFQKQNINSINKYTSRTSFLESYDNFNFKVLKNQKFDFHFKKCKPSNFQNHFNKKQENHLNLVKPLWSNDKQSDDIALKQLQPLLIMPKSKLSVNSSEIFWIPQETYRIVNSKFSIFEKSSNFTFFSTTSKNQLFKLVNRQGLKRNYLTKLNGVIRLFCHPEFQFFTPSFKIKSVSKKDKNKVIKEKSDIDLRYSLNQQKLTKKILLLFREKWECYKQNQKKMKHMHQKKSSIKNSIDLKLFKSFSNQNSFFSDLIFKEKDSISGSQIANNNLHIQIQHGWVYIPQDSKTIQSMHQSMIEAGKVILEDISFQKNRVYLKCISLEQSFFLFTQKIQLQKKSSLSLQDSMIDLRNFNSILTNQNSRFYVLSSTEQNPQTKRFNQLFSSNTENNEENLTTTNVRSLALLIQPMQYKLLPNLHCYKTKISQNQKKSIDQSFSILLQANFRSKFLNKQKFNSNLININPNVDFEVRSSFELPFLEVKPQKKLFETSGFWNFKKSKKSNFKTKTSQKSKFNLDPVAKLPSNCQNQSNIINTNALTRYFKKFMIIKNQVSQNQENFDYFSLKKPYSLIKSTNKNFEQFYFSYYPLNFLNLHLEVSTLKHMNVFFTIPFSQFHSDLSFSLKNFLVLKNSKNINHLNNLLIKPLKYSVKLNLSIPTKQSGKLWIDNNTQWNYSVAAQSLSTSFYKPCFDIFLGEKTGYLGNQKFAAHFFMNQLSQNKSRPSVISTSQIFRLFPIFKNEFKLNSKNWLFANQKFAYTSFLSPLKGEVLPCSTNPWVKHSKKTKTLILTKSDLISVSLKSEYLNSKKTLKPFFSSLTHNQSKTKSFSFGVKFTDFLIQKNQFFLNHEKNLKKLYSSDLKTIEQTIIRHEKKLYKVKGLRIGSINPYIPLRISKFVIPGDIIGIGYGIVQPGQIIHMNCEKITLRCGQVIAASPKAIIHAYHSDFVKKNQAVITLPFQTLKTGDIVQGIPKVEQYFEARLTKAGRLVRDSLPNLLQYLFERYSCLFPLEQAARRSIIKIQQILIDGVQRVYRSQGVGIVDKHLEVVVRQMTSKIVIINSDYTGFFPGELFDIEFIENFNKFSFRKVKYEPVLLGITRASLEVDSFLSAASFQQTTKILSNAAICRKKDFLKGLKENLMVGNLIPAGTGYFTHMNYIKQNN